MMTPEDRIAALLELDDDALERIAGMLLALEQLPCNECVDDVLACRAELLNPSSEYKGAGVMPCQIRIDQRN